MGCFRAEEHLSQSMCTTNPLHTAPFWTPKSCSLCAGQMNSKSNDLNCLFGSLEMREIYIIDSLKKYRNFCLQVRSTPFQITYLQKHCFYLLSALEKPAIIFDRFFLSSCLVLVSRINSIRSIANRCSALSFLLFSTVFLRVYLALQSNQKRKGRMLSQMMLRGEYFNDLELKCFQSSCLALFFSSFASPI